MYTSRARVALVAIMLSAILGTGLVIASYNAHYTIPSSGFISPPQPQTSPTTSEIRAVFYKVQSMANPSDWDAVMGTLQPYGINTIVLEMMGNMYTHYPSDYVPHWPIDDLGPAVVAAHARDMELHISMNVMLSSPGAEYQVVAADGTKRDWLDPTNPNSRALLKNLVQEVVTKYDIDGFMFDYVRYATGDVPYGEYAKQKLEEYLGETITDFPGDFAPGGSRYQEFIEWRTRPINDLVRDMRDWMLVIKPDLEFSAAVWGWEPGWPTYNRYWIGQDATYWVKEGYLDWVAPMHYTTDLNRLRLYFSDMIQGMIAGPEGEIPLVPFLATAYEVVSVDPITFKQEIDLMRELGADGWIIFAYGGSGEGYPYAPDIRPFLDLIDLFPRFSLKDIGVSIGSDVTITWTTDLPATSKVEYSTTPLFNESLVYDPRVDFSYWNINYVSGTIVEDATPVTSHSITLTNLQEGTLYYYRVQSQDQSGIATSKVYTFRL